ncbi:MAG: ferrous iron transport protein B [Pseudanabaena sp. M57BS1SP1A06MG]|nr:ferrous iron transport protein B [Pseudanabaena sp. M051S1SP2A07QC]MCA6573983.1 ferrous iron transport protein B [Pseudanabaena sp. M53BS1SP1A06MG]MCA6583865.1 ferrous iron transport protein B [Pseudanabaena sp. M34BS1SP1A06MG]MCA6593084.1 ferrous iron transport protein B [Pseudanabaena sp. M38BS1SP1A06MG]MCA6597972.1 ferrous iron transport protein B [Pseudanabaena sp. M046S1SP1A06QC]MCA6601979.1 ferrous iron transport protein B [Pseudanabaena sp. M57BS1SP1A06MG]
MKQIAVLGMPNTGKSTFFNRFTGSHAHIGNWPGITVDLMMAEVKLGNESVEVIDLPGIYDLRGFSEDEAVVRCFLEKTPLNLVLIILNTTQIDRQMILPLQIKQLGLPAVLLLNMADEANRFGVKVQPDLLAQRLGIPVMPISAKYGMGYQKAIATITESLQQHQDLVQVEGLEKNLLSDRQLANDLKEILDGAVQMPLRLADQWTRRLDRILLHPLLGLPIFFGAMYLIFQAIYAIGTPLQKLLGNGLDWFKGIALEPLLSTLPAFIKGFLIDGLYVGIGTVAAFLPVIFLFFLCMAIVEDSGYLSRAAFLMDALMERLGLDGRSFVMSLMGFGCNVPAILGTRVMRSPSLRMLSMLVIPFSLCSARLNVFLFMSTALFAPDQSSKVIFSLYLFSFAAALLTAALFKGKFPSQEPLVLELPPYRLPTMKQILVRAWCEVKHFWIWSRKFIIFGVIAIWLLNNLPTDVPTASPQTLSGMIGQALQPLFAPLGINPQMTIALFFGFIAKEIVLGGLAVIYGQADDGNLAGAIAQQIDWVQGYSFMLFTLLYVPCLSTIAVIKSESKSVKFAMLSVGWSLGLAWIASFVFYQGARALGF